MLVAGTTVAIGGQLQQGRAAQRAANESAAQDEYTALVEQDNALAQAQQIRRQGESARGQMLAAVASSGVKIGAGSTLDAERQVMQDYETDASMAILTGNRSAAGLRGQAELTRRAGRNARAASNIAAFNTLLSSGSQGMKLAGGSLSGWDARGPNGTNDRSAVSVGNNMDWFLRNGTSGD
ncbi:hypothetical protein CDN99_06655 [Roseateles aquatilis]|uniref:Uncharacterized protein n=2 Tax=Roseateles aquatilis TaxID=431061 RepID=A0A246JHP2_9BURK|nr:hypothetical protein CDN99_06655 [Roseateles aquatilis]